MEIAAISREFGSISREIGTVSRAVGTSLRGFCSFLTLDARLSKTIFYLYEDWEAATGLRWARLLAQLRTSGKSMPVKDSLIAATALVHGLPVVTLNRRDLEKAGVEIIDPSA